MLSLGLFLGRAVDPAKTFIYKGMMYSDVPNLASVFGYTNASWTLKCELVSSYVCRLLKFMDHWDYVQCTPRKTDPAITEEPILNFTSGYVQRALSFLPSQGSRRPWKLYQNYAFDMTMLRRGEMYFNDATICFQGWQSCASCHFKGLTDGVIWQFAAGPRKSVPLNATFSPHQRTRQRLLVSLADPFTSCEGKEHAQMSRTRLVEPGQKPVN